MIFKNIEVQDKILIDPFLQCDGFITAERNFAVLYCWGKALETKFCITDGMLFLLIEHPEILLYYMPLGSGDMENAKKLIKDDADARRKPFKIIGITKEKLDFFDDYKTAEVRDSFNYIYDSESFISLKGKKLHSKRNFINRFKTEHEGNWEYRELDFSKDKERIFEFLKKWRFENSENRSDFKNEYSAIEYAFEYHTELEIKGGVLLLKGQIIGFSLAAAQNSLVMDVMIEKADHSVNGAYQMLANCFAKEFCSEYKYINREEDMGIEGLRKSKLSYNPVFLSEVYETIGEFKR